MCFLPLLSDAAHRFCDECARQQVQSGRCTQCEQAVCEFGLDTLLGLSYYQSPPGVQFYGQTAAPNVFPSSLYPSSPASSSMLPLQQSFPSAIVSTVPYGYSSSTGVTHQANGMSYAAQIPLMDPTSEEPASITLPLGTLHIPSQPKFKPNKPNKPASDARSHKQPDQQLKQPYAPVKPSKSDQQATTSQHLKPTAMCKNYPNCNPPNGRKCTYWHPGEDIPSNGLVPLRTTDISGAPTYECNRKTPCTLAKQKSCKGWHAGETLPNGLLLPASSSPTYGTKKNNVNNNKAPKTSPTTPKTAAPSHAAPHQAAARPITPNRVATSSNPASPSRAPKQRADPYYASLSHYEADSYDTTQASGVSRPH